MFSPLTTKSEITTTQRTNRVSPQHLIRSDHHPHRSIYGIHPFPRSQPFRRSQNIKHRRGFQIFCIQVDRLDLVGGGKSDGCVCGELEVVFLSARDSGRGQGHRDCGCFSLRGRVQEQGGFDKEQQRLISREARAAMWLPDIGYVHVTILLRNGGILLFMLWELCFTGLALKRSIGQLLRLRRIGLEQSTFSKLGALTGLHQAMQCVGAILIVGLHSETLIIGTFD